MSDSTKMDDRRLERIENKIDELGQAIITLARLEEAQAQNEKARIEANQRYDNSIAVILKEIRDLRIKEIEQDKEIAENSRITGYIRWIVGVIVTAFAGAAAIYFFSL